MAIDPGSRSWSWAQQAMPAAGRKECRLEEDPLALLWLLVPGSFWTASVL